MKTISIEGRDYEIKVERDDDMLAPWLENDGHGIVTDWLNGDKKPGEWVLAADGGLRRYYDHAGTMKKAKAEGWGLPPEEAKGLTPAQVIEKAVQKDFRHLSAWCADEWHWCIVIVKGPDNQVESMGGIESGDDSCMEEIAKEIANNLHYTWNAKVKASGIDF